MMAETNMLSLANAAKRHAVVRLDDGSLAMLWFAPHPKVKRRPGKRFSRSVVKVRLLRSGSYLSVAPHRIVDVFNDGDSAEAFVQFGWQS